MKQLKITTKITNRDSFSIDKYLNEIAKLPLIKEEEEVELARRIRKGDQVALDKLTKSNLRFVVSVAKQYQNQGLSLNDLINEGNIGLIKAATKFDETKGFKFISYAVWWIRQSILQALVEQTRLVRLPMNKATFINKINKASNDFEQKNEREPSEDELAEIMEVKIDDINLLKSCFSTHLSTDQPMNEDDNTTAGDQLTDDSVPKPDDHLNEVAFLRQIDRILHSLTEREMLIIQYYFGLNKFHQHYSLDEIGDKMSLTRERVRQLKDKSLKKIRNSVASEQLKQFLYQ
jgi:RNA polymerase primary sigma factor